MKKFIFPFLLVAALAVFSMNRAEALVCETSQAAGGGDACYTQVKLAGDVTTAIPAGTVVCYDFTQDTVAEAASQVVECNVSVDRHIVAGVTKNRMAINSADVGLVQVWGKGTIRTTGVIASGDRLYPSSTAGVAGQSYGINTSGPDVVSADPIAFALEGDTDASIDAFIVVW